MRGSVSQLADLLSQLAEVLQPFVSSHGAGDRVWEGQAYAPAVEAREADAVATAWWATANTAAALIAGEQDLSPQQHDYFKRTLFGGMGSLNDFSLDAARWGSEAKEANRQLEIIRSALYTCFQTLTPREHQKT
jgi:hypothetical protein